ncbi:MAG: ProQ/FINO family protein [Methylococcales bacterium]|nr:ProQ/FINO family protein [Methylococcales bacterium]
MKKKISREESTKTLNTLIELFPNTFFNNDKEKTKPLKCGIRHEILAQYPEYFDKNVLRVAMGFYCSRKHYFKSVLTNTSRVDLEGKLCGEITEENKVNALKGIEEINKRFADTNEKVKPEKSKKTSKNTKQGELVGEVAKNDKCLAQDRLDRRNKPEKSTILTEPTPIEVIEPMQPTEEKIKSTKLVLKKKTVAPTAKVTIAKVESSPSPIKATNDNVAIAKSLKVTLVVEPASIPVIDSTGMKKVTLTIQVANTDIQITVDLSAKSYRKAIGSIEELGTDGCNAILQGSMKQYGTIDDAGLVVQPKKTASSE